MEEEIKLMKGNEALAMAMIRYGADGYFGYPITPQSEVLETLMAQKPWETTATVPWGLSFAICPKLAKGSESTRHASGVLVQS